MFYPLKFKPVYKNYLWGGRNFEKFGRKLPEGIIAESWEISCHPDGISIVSNGEFSGMPLPQLIQKFGRQLVGKSLSEKDVSKFPLLVKFIDANDRLSVQVHPDDAYAQLHENEYGKNETWYIIYAHPGSKIVYGVKPGTTKDIFARAISENRVEEYLRYIEVFPGDVFNVPAGLLHAIGEGIVLAEIQQNSNSTYRVYDYNRLDKNGNKRPLHIQKALDVIDFELSGRIEKSKGLEIKIGRCSIKKYLVANKYYSIELYDIKEKTEEIADGSKFYIYVFVDGEGKINYESGSIQVKCGESILIPATMGAYSLEGNIKFIKSYVPDIKYDIIAPLMAAGYSKENIIEGINCCTVSHDI